MKKVSAIFIIALLSAAFACKQSDKSEEVKKQFTIQRGTNIAHWLSQSEKRGPERVAFFTREDVESIAALGFDHIRLPIDEMQMWDEEMNKEPEAFALLHSAIGWCEDAGLRVIVDLHILRSHYFNAAEKPLWTDPAEQDKFIALWADLSEELGEYPDWMVAYELMNEAVADDPDQWNHLIARAIASIRESEPARIIVVGSNMWQGPETFPDLVIPENDTNIILSFHFYTPFALTHYKASWTAIYDYDGPVRYPGEVVETKDMKGLPDNILEAFKWATGYFMADTLRKRMAPPIQYAKEHGLPLYCGEFGALPTSPRADRLRWYDDMIRIMESEGIAWANWCYKGSFSIFRKDGEVDQELIDIMFQNLK